MKVGVGVCGMFLVSPEMKWNETQTYPVAATQILHKIWVEFFSLSLVVLYHRDGVKEHWI